MIPLEAWIGFLSDYGLWIVGLAAVIEGPIVTVVSTFLAREGLFALWPLAVVLMVADLVGDVGFYALGRHGLGWMSPRWRQALGLGRERTELLAAHFDRRGGRILVFGKLTHSAGAAVLIAAGIARMPLPRFLGFNFLATVPKTAAFMALGWVAGDAYARIEVWIGRGALIMLALLVLLALAWFLWRRTCPPK